MLAITPLLVPAEGVSLLAHALAATLDPVSLLLLLQMQMADVDRADAALDVLDTRIRAELADYQPPSACCRRFRALTSAVPPPSSPRSDPTWAPSARRGTSAPGPASPQATTPVPGTPLRAGAQRKPHPAGYPRRMRPRSRPNPGLPVLRLSPRSRRQARLQTRPSRHRAQALARDTRRPARRPACPWRGWWMESTGVFWKSVPRALAAAEVEVWVVNARHVKRVPGRKTDTSDSRWLATLARYGRVNRASWRRRGWRNCGG